MAEIILILGGARSGKSTLAETMAAGLGERVLYVATAESGDGEMADRIAQHRQSRPPHWPTLEAPTGVGKALAAVTNAPDVILLDCLTLLVSNILLSMEDQPTGVIAAAVQAEIESIAAAQKKLNVPLIIVSNEVGLGLVPPYPLGRVYRDALGRANQMLAQLADRVLFMVAGLPMTLKG